MSAQQEAEVVREALQEFAYRPGQPVFSRYEAATAALGALTARAEAAEARVAALEQALRKILDHPLVANRGDENCDWHCVAEIQNLACDGLAAAGEPEAATP